MNVRLPSDLEEYVESLVKSGNYPGRSEVIQEALREHQVNRPSFDVIMTPELEKLLDEGMEDLDQGKTTDELRRQR